MAKKKKALLAEYNKYRENSYYYYELNCIQAMFEYGSIDFRKEFLELQLLKHGWGALAKHENGKIYAGYSTWYDLDEYGLPTGKGEFFTRHGFSFQIEYNVNCVIICNNQFALPEYLLEQTAKMFAETDISMLSCLKKSRVNPVPVASDSKVKTAIEGILSDVENGDTKAISYEGALEDLIEGKDPITMLNLTDPAQTDKLQYLSKFNDDILRRIATFYGHSLSSGSKMAQVTTAELEGYTTFSRIYPFELLNARREGLERANNIFGSNMTVKFSRAWEHLEQSIILQEGKADELETNQTDDDSNE